MTDRPGIGGGKDLAYEAETLADFKRRIDDIIDELESSPASHKQISNQDITPDAYGTGFSAAEDLSSQYEKAHERLKTLSRLFGEQLEALGIATQIVDKGYENIEAEHRQRFHSIRTRVEEYHESRHGDQQTGRNVDAKDTDKSDDLDSEFR
ncbi:hypothetical protein GCM10010420_06950 [Streptomyces glaucosporus]|uniref:Uncharacterized protein n=1 Tax=Streptomyces glaucosporus TaxID=284044 RepID=A0ABN3HS04_9ACTN